jgi:hypothetical protein
MEIGMINTNLNALARGQVESLLEFARLYAEQAEGEDSESAWSAVEMAREFLRKADDAEDLWESRFLVRLMDDDGSMRIWPVTEESVIRAYTNHLAEGESMSDYFYCDPQRGDLHPTGARVSIEGNSVAVVAGGNVVSSFTIADPI